MPATRVMKEFKVKTTTGEMTTIRRRCFGSGEVVQRQFEKMIYDEAAKKLRPAPKS